MTSSGRPPKIEVRFMGRSPSGQGDALTINRVWLPMLVWEDVRVKMRTTRGLTMLEKFVIECLLRLDGCDLQDLQEVAAIGPEVGEWLLTSCLQKKLACRTGDRYHAEKAVCEWALEHNELPHHAEQRVDIVCLPETDEFVLLDDSSQFLRRLRQVRPSSNYPLPTQWQSSERGEFLNRAREEGRLYGQKATACVEFHDDAVIKVNQCPAYQASVTLGDIPECDSALKLIGQRTQRKKKASAFGEHDDMELVEVALGFPVLPRLRSRWKSTCATADPQLRDKLEKAGLELIDRHGVGWTANVGSAAADALAAEHLLTQSMELEVQVNEEVEFSVPLELVPSSDESRLAFSRDHVVGKVLSATSEHLVAVATEDPNVNLSEVRGRLWRLKYFGKVYQLRQEEDFLL